MNDYYDRNGEPLQWGDAVIALKGDEENGYTAACFMVDYPDGHHTLMLKQCYTYADIYQHIPTGKEELRRRLLTRLGPARSISCDKFYEWRWEVEQLAKSGANIDCQQVMRLKPVEPNHGGRYI